MASCWRAQTPHACCVFVEQSVWAARTSVARYMRGPPDVVGDSRDQAHLPAEQPASRQDPWLPSAHAHPRRPRDPRGPSPQGPRGALGLTSPSVLPAAHRMRRAADFEQAVRRGARGGRDTLVVHLTTRTDHTPAGPVVGLVVSKAVGTAVTRNLVKRRLRELVRTRSVGCCRANAGIVVRALPAAATSNYARLGDDLDAALETAVRRSSRRAGA